MRTVTVNWSNIHQHGTLWHQHLCLRKRLFVDQMGWKVPHSARCEWDQYDTSNSIYVITHLNGKVLSASRLNPTNFQSPLGSYMIRDAVLGLLPDISPQILDKSLLPKSDDVWEATRFTVDPELCKEQAKTSLAANARALAQVAHDQGIRRLIALMPPAYIRWLSKLDLPTTRLGPTTCNDNNERCCVMEMDVERY